PLRAPRPGRSRLWGSARRPDRGGANTDRPDGPAALPAPSPYGGTAKLRNCASGRQLQHDLAQLLRLVGHHEVAGLALVIVPAALGLNLVAEPGKRSRLPVAGEDVDPARDLRFFAGVAHRFRQRQQRMAPDLSR